MDGQQKSPQLAFMFHSKETDESDADSDGISERSERSHQVDALLDPQIPRKQQEHFRKRRHVGVHPSVLTKRLQAHEKPGKPPTPMAFSSTEPCDDHPVIPADSLVLARSKRHVIGSSPQIKPKLTKPLKLQQSKDSRKVQQGFDFKRYLPTDNMTTSESLSRSLDIPESSQKTKRSLLTDGKASSFDSNFSLMEFNTDSDEEIMV